MSKKTGLEDMADTIELAGAVRSVNAELGAGDWEACLTPAERHRLHALSAVSAGTWGKEKLHNGICDADVHDVIELLDTSRDSLAKNIELVFGEQLRNGEFRPLAKYMLEFAALAIQRAKIRSNL